MALFDLLSNACSPQQKLEDAISTDNVEQLKKLLEDGVDPNMKLHKYGGDRAIHLASRNGNSPLIKLLIEGGAAVDVPNDFDISPIFCAFRADHLGALKVLMKHCKLDKHLNYLWVDGIYVESKIPDNVVIQRVLIVSSPNILLQKHHLRPTYWDVFFTLNFVKLDPDIESFSLHSENIKLLFLTAFKSRDSVFCLYEKKILNKFQSMQRSTRLRSTIDPNTLKKYLEELEHVCHFVSQMKKNPSSLCHLCRLAIRGTFWNKCNVFYGASQLPLPTQLRNFIVFDE